MVGENAQLGDVGENEHHLPKEAVEVVGHQIVGALQEPGSNRQHPQPGDPRHQHRGDQEEVAGVQEKRLGRQGFVEREMHELGCSREEGAAQ